MGTPFRFTVMLGGVIVAYAWSIHAAHHKLTSAALKHASQGGESPFHGEIRRGAVVIAKRSYEPFTEAP